MSTATQVESPLEVCRRVIGEEIPREVGALAAQISGGEEIQPDAIAAEAKDYATMWLEDLLEAMRVKLSTTLLRELIPNIERIQKVAATSRRIPAETNELRRLLLERRDVDRTDAAVHSFEIQITCWYGYRELFEKLEGTNPLRVLPPTPVAANDRVAAGTDDDANAPFSEQEMIKAKQAALAFDEEFGSCERIKDTDALADIFS